MKRRTRRLVLLATMAIAPAFLEGCILTDLLGNVGGLLGGGGGGAGAGILGAAQQGGLGGQQANSRPLAPAASINGRVDQRI